MEDKKDNLNPPDQTPVESTAPGPTSPPLPTTNHKPKKILIIGVAILVLVIGLFWLGDALGLNPFNQIPSGVAPMENTPMSKTTPIPTFAAEPIPADWKTYTNSKYGFSFKYPSDKVVEIDEESPDINICTNQKGVADIKMYPKDYKKSEVETDFLGDLLLNISVVDNPENMPPEEYLQKTCPALITEDKISDKLTTQTAAGYSSLLITYKNVMGEQQEAVVQKDNKLYFIHGFSSQLPNPVFDQILTTFKFAK